MVFLRIILLSLFISQSASADFLPEWTILHYGSGNNNLDDLIQEDVNQMEMIGSTPKIQIVTQLASLRTRSVKRYHIQKDSDPQVITSPIVGDLGNVDMGDWKSLADFIIWGMKNFPARHYFVIIGGHGSGWRQKASEPAANPIRVVSPDDFSGNSISTTQLGQVFSAVRHTTGRRVDIFGADACLMASIEVATEISANVDYMIASQELEPGEGWVYQEFLMRLNRESDQRARNIARVSARSYMAGYMRNRADSYQRIALTMSAVDLAAMNRFNRKFSLLPKIIAKATNLAGYNAALAGARGRVSDRSYADIGLLLVGILQLPLDEATRRAVAEILAEYERNLVVTEHSSQSHSDTTGLTVWAPLTPEDTRAYKSAYNELLFDRFTHWGSLFN